MSALRRMSALAALAASVDHPDPGVRREAALAQQHLDALKARLGEVWAPTPERGMLWLPVSTPWEPYLVWALTDYTHTVAIETGDQMRVYGEPEDRTLLRGLYHRARRLVLERLAGLYADPSSPEAVSYAMGAAHGVADLLRLQRLQASRGTGLVLAGRRQRAEAQALEAHPDAVVAEDDTTPEDFYAGYAQGTRLDLEQP